MKKTLAGRKSIILLYLLISLNKLYILFQCFVAVFDKQESCIGSISTPISSHDHNKVDQAIAIDSYQRYFRKLDIFFSRKQQSAIKTDWKTYSLLLYQFCMLVSIFKIATSLQYFQQLDLLQLNRENKWKSNYS